MRKNCIREKKPIVIRTYDIENYNEGWKQFNEIKNTID